MTDREKWLKAKKVIESCKTFRQLRTAVSWLNLLFDHTFTLGSSYRSTYLYRTGSYRGDIQRKIYEKRHTIVKKGGKGGS